MSIEEAVKVAPTCLICELVESGIYVRKMQGEYFNLRTREMLYAAKDAEDRFDRALRAVVNAGKPTRPILL